MHYSLQHLIRDVYKTLDESEDFVGFDLKYVHVCFFSITHSTTIRHLLSLSLCVYSMCLISWIIASLPCMCNLQYRHAE